VSIEAVGQLNLSLLDPTHDVSAFDCKHSDAINQWLRERALLNQQGHLSRVWVLVCPAGIVRAFFTLSGTVLDTSYLASRDRRSVGESVCPAQLIGRFATDQSVKGNDIGTLLMDLAFEKYVEILGLTTNRFLILHAKSDWHVEYYGSRFGFKPTSRGAEADGTTLMYLKSSAVLERFGMKAALSGQAIA
jgi:predicted GNAT family N-acyltransferase